MLGISMCYPTLGILLNLEDYLMKKLLLTTALSTLALGSITTNVLADAGYMIGINYALDGRASLSNLGVGARILSSDQRDEVVAVAGVSLYPWAEKKVGVDIGAGYTFDDSTAVVAYDFIQAKPLASVGWTDTDR